MCARNVIIRTSLCIKNTQDTDFMLYVLCVCVFFIAFHFHLHPGYIFLGEKVVGELELVHRGPFMILGRAFHVC